MARKTVPATLEVMRDLWALAHALEARSKRMQRSRGVTGPQRLVLRIVGEMPECSPGEVARQLHLHPGTVSRHVSSLVRMGLVRRVSDDGDGRRQRLALSRKGTALARDHRGTIEEAGRAAVGAAPLAEIAAARRFVVRIAEELA